MTLVINASFDSSVTDLNTLGNPKYDPTLYTEYTTAARTAVQFFEATIANPITLSIAFGWGEVAGSPISAGAIGESSTFSTDVTYTALLNAVKSSETTSSVQQTAVATLPATDPTHGAKFAVATAEAKAIGLDTSYTGPDGSVGLDSTQTYSWTQAAVQSGTYDAVGVIEHEISEVLGREDDAGARNTYTLLDMFRYTAADGKSGDAPGTAVGERDEPFVPGYSTTAAASNKAGLNSYSYFSYDGSTIALQYDIPTKVAQGADIGDWAASVQGDSFGYADQGMADTVSTTDLQELNVIGYDLACYLPDTSIATPSGEVPVQKLVVGDLVMTHHGEAKPIVWIGHGKALATRGRRSAATPVIVRKGAIADNVPNADLRITKGHALYVDGVLIPAEFLVNHRSIVWDDRAREVTVYHLELPDHAILLANGVPAESFRDDGNRWLFQNNETAPDHAAKPPFAPVLTGGAIVDAAWKRLLDRSGPRPGLPLTGDPDLHLLVDGYRIDPIVRPNGLHSFRMPPRPAAVSIVSRAAAQDELGLARDPRPLGVAVRRIVLWQAARPTVIEAADERLSRGFHAYEPDNGFRWTDGHAAVPILGGVRPITGLDLHVAATTRYPLLRDNQAVA